MDVLKGLREQRGLSQAKLAALADINPSTLNQIERGRRHPTTTTLQKLATALGVEIGDFFPKELPLPFDPPSTHVDWPTAVVEATELRPWAQAEIAAELDAWASDHAPKHLDTVGMVLQQAYDAVSALIASLPKGPPECPLDKPEWEHIREADGFYHQLVAEVESCGLAVVPETARDRRPSEVRSLEVA